MDFKKLNKVKKGLECCKGYPKKCDECPYHDEVGGSCNYLTEDSLDVINELHSELGCYVSDQGILLHALELKNNLPKETVLITKREYGDLLQAKDLLPFREETIKTLMTEKKASIYDLYEMCNYYTCEKNSCTECPLYNYTCDPTLADNVDTINDLTLKWKKEHKEKKDETN